jgi:uncharacterized protein YndB with AHSA1/START domain
VWDAIATGNGITSWFMVTELEEREGGAVVFHMGDTASHGHVTHWDPPRRLEYAEPEWAEFSGHPDGQVTPLLTEFLVEATSGGTCVVRVVSSAFGVGADWEQEFFDEMEKGWTPFFENLQLVVENFSGRHAHVIAVEGMVAGPLEAVYSSARESLGVDEVGQTVEVHGAKAQVHRVNAHPGPSELLLRLSDPVAGLLGVLAHGGPEGPTYMSVQGRVFSDDGAKFVEQQSAAWRDWLSRLTEQFASTGAASS